MLQKLWKRGRRMMALLLAMSLVLGLGLQAAIPASAAEGVIELDYNQLMELDEIAPDAKRSPAAADGKYVVFLDGTRETDNWVKFHIPASTLPEGSYSVSMTANHGSTRSGFAVYADDALVCPFYDTNSGSGNQTTKMGIVTVGSEGVCIKLQITEDSHLTDWQGGQYELVLFGMSFTPVSVETVKGELQDKIKEAETAMGSATEAGKLRLQAALEDAKRVLEMENPSLQDIMASITCLDDAIQCKNMAWTITVDPNAEMVLHVQDTADTGEVVTLNWYNAPAGKQLLAIHILNEKMEKLGEVDLETKTFTMPGEDVILRPVLGDMEAHHVTVEPVDGVQVTVSPENPKSGELVTIQYEVTDTSKYLDTFEVIGADLEKNMTFRMGDTDVTVKAVLRDRNLDSNVVSQTEDTVTIHTDHYEIKIEKQGFRYSLYNKMTKELVADKHDVSGIMLANEPIETTELQSVEDNRVIFQAKTASMSARIEVVLNEKNVNLQVYPGAFTAESSGAIQCSAGEPAYLISKKNFSGSYEVEAKETLDGLSSGSGAGVVVGYTDDANYINVRKIDNAWPSAKIEVLRFENGKVTKTVVGECSKNDQIMVHVDGKNLGVHVNGTKLGTYTSDTEITGKVGYRSYKANTVLDTYQVRQIENNEAKTVLNIQTYEDYTNNFTFTGEAFSEVGNAGRMACKIEFQTKGIMNQSGLAPIYGMGDNGGYGGNANLAGRTFDNVMNDGGGIRFVSNFAIFPEKRLAEVLFSEEKKIAAFTENANMEGLAKSPYADGMYYFFGSKEDNLRDIYKDYKQTRNAEGYLDAEPIYDYFGVGFEGYGAMGWAVAQETMKEYLQGFLDRGYNIKWGVLGSGFWKGQRSGGTTTTNDPYQGCTTSFGIYDNGKDMNGNPETTAYPIRYPDAPSFADIHKNFDDDPSNDVPYDTLFGPNTFQQFFQKNNVKTIFGLRVNFKSEPEMGGKLKVTNDGAWVQEGLEKGYFLKNEDGSNVQTTVLFPAGKVYMLDASKPEALAWYKEGTQHWYVNGWKEDTMATNQGTFHNHDGNTGFSDYYLCYDETASGEMVRNDTMEMVRNAAYSVPGDILRINDTGAGSPGRIITNTAAFAASGQGNVYPDIVGANFAMGSIGNAGYQNFLARNAIACGMMPSVSLGNLPWGKDNPLEYAVLNAMNWHSTYQPYIYDAAHKSWETGYPYSYNPLFLAYPDDPNVANQFSNSVSTAQWLIGDSMMAAPILDNVTSSSGGNRADTRDVYLPAGSQWMDMNTGKVYEGGQTLKDVKMPLDTMPVYIGRDAITVREMWQDPDGTLPKNSEYGFANRNVLYNDLYCDVYPISPEGTEYEFIYPFSPEKVDDTFQKSELQKSVITNQIPNGKFNADNIVVVDSNGNQVEFTVNPTTKALSFKIEPGVNYTVKHNDHTTETVVEEAKAVAAKAKTAADQAAEAAEAAKSAADEAAKSDAKDKTAAEAAAKAAEDAAKQAEAAKAAADAAQKAADDAAAAQTQADAEAAKAEAVKEAAKAEAAKEKAETALAEAKKQLEAQKEQEKHEQENQDNPDHSDVPVIPPIVRPENPEVPEFADVERDDYFYDAVQWAVAQNITTGTGLNTFSPDAFCTRAQAVTFLWRAAGQPAPKQTIMPFTDVAPDAYYRDAVLWALENNITAGTSATTFSPDEACTRAQIVTFQWRAAGQPAAGKVNPFKDVAEDEFYADAVLWAVEQNITTGLSADTFGPDHTCTRGQIVTFLYRNKK